MLIKGIIKFYKGILPCFLFGSIATLFLAFQKLWPVGAVFLLGKLPHLYNHGHPHDRDAQIYQCTLRFFPDFFTLGSTASAISFLKMISEAPFAPITAISTDGQARSHVSPNILLGIHLVICASSTKPHHCRLRYHTRGLGIAIKNICIAPQRNHTLLDARNFRII